jgi:hypothetical protein
MKKRIPLALTFNNVSVKHIPKIGTAAYTLLLILSDGALHTRASLIRHPILGENLRSALQRLKGDELGNWLIESVPIEGTSTTALQLDPRHLSGETEQDAEARLERRKQLKEVSAKGAIQGRIREPKALRERGVAQTAYFKSLGNAANYEK